MPITWDNTPSPATPVPRTRDEKLDLQPTQIRDDLTQVSELITSMERCLFIC